MARLIQSLSFVALTIAASVVIGCSSDAPSPQKGATQSVAAPELTPPEGNTEPPLSDVSDAVASIPSAGKESAATPVNVQLISPAEYGDVIGKLKGKVVLVDFWATWCGPCRKAFPHTVKLHQELAAKGFEVVTVAIDDPESKADVEAFLTSVNAPFQNLQCNLTNTDKSFEAYEIGEAGLPHYKLYDRAGKLRKTFTADLATMKGVDLAQLDAAVAALVAEGQ